MNRSKMKHRTFWFTVSASTAAVSLLTFQNCTPQTFSVMTKDRKLSGSPVFSYAATGTINVNGGANGNINTMGGSGANGNLNTMGGSGANGNVNTTGGAGANGNVNTTGGGGANGNVNTTGGGGANGNVNTGDGNANGSGGGSTGQMTDQTSPGMPGMPGTLGPNGENMEQSIPAATTVAVPVHFGCSTRRSVQQGNVAEATSLTVRLTSSNKDDGDAACTFADSTLRDTILQNKTIPLSLVDKNCPTLPDGKYYVFVAETGKNNDLNWTDSGGMSTFAVTKDTSGVTAQWSIQENDFLTLVTDFNDKYAGDMHQMVALNDSQCDVQASPLMVRLEAPGAAPERLSLTSPANGVIFDILGANALPTPYTPVQISWIRSEPQFFFVALPDQNGQVKGVDQLFGDNTKGPDGQFAANGFLALAKYDNDGDGFITSLDPVFSKLRLWRDDNGDGIAQASELHSLASMNVTSIDLRYDPKYHEADQYGNEIKYKSIVRTDDGRMHIIFDLWFAHK